MSLQQFNLNGHLVGIAMKEMVRRTIRAIRLRRVQFDVSEKETSGKAVDYLTSADLAAQDCYLRVLTECFPWAGIVAEERNFEKKTEYGYFFSVDPLDGTKAFVRRQSHGVGTMIALARGQEIISAWVGDVMTQEIYGFRPDSLKVHRITEYSDFELLVVDETLPLKSQNVIFRSDPYQSGLRWSSCATDCFKNFEIESGSIGLTFARLWKGEVGGIVVNPGNTTPWDRWPVAGISKKMGFIFLRRSLNGEVRELEEFNPVISTSMIREETHFLVIHRSRLEEFRAWESSADF